MGGKKKVGLAPSIPLESVEGKINWELCCICQEGSGKPPVCPADNPNKNLRNAGYISFSDNVELLKKYSHVFPSGRKPEHFDEGCGVKETLIKNKAKWHSKCIIKYTTRFSTILQTLTSDDVPQEQKVHDIKTRSSSVAIDPKEEVCFICKNKRTELNNEPLHHCMSKEVRDSVEKYAKKANNTEILAFLSEGDLIAQEAKYHGRCMLDLWKESQDKPTQHNSEYTTCESLALADLLLFMHEQLEKSGTQCAFNTATLRKQYTDRLSQLLGGTQPAHEPHSSRFREKILLHFPDLLATKSGREYVLTVKNADILKNFDLINDDFDALAVNRFTRIVRKQIFATDTTFTGSFSDNCEENSVPPALLALVNMLLYGSTILSECRATKPAISISQLILTNMLKSRPSGDIVRFTKTRETPLPLYMGLSIYGSSRNKLQIDNLHQRGLAVSSNRIYEVTGDLARYVVQTAKEEGVVCPSALKKGFFTVAAFDNIDVKPGSKTSQEEFHGSGISLFQLPLKGEIPIERKSRTSFVEAAESGSRTVPNLPDEYSDVPDFFLKNTQPSPPAYSSDVCKTAILLAGNEDLWHGESDWLNHVHEILTEKEIELEAVSWAAFRSEQQSVTALDVSISSLLPLFHEKSSSPAMVKHAMDLVKSCTEFLNPGQTPVMCADQPLFTLAKLIQWNHPDNYCEKNFVLLFGPLHIEQNFLRIIGEVMEGSGWTGIIGNSGILSSGSAEGLLKVSAITKARLFHQYTAAVLHSLLKDAYSNDTHHSDEAFETWIKESAAQSPTFKYWLLVLRLELLLLKFVRSVREANFSIFVECIAAMLPWFFSSGHHLYARWLTVHALDLLSLEKTSPEVFRRFSNGAFVVRKTTNPFSCLGVDHAHEQNNADVKSKGGAIGVTQDPSALRRWTLAGPEVTRLVTEFEQQTDKKPARHQEHYPRFQKRFLECCAALKASFGQGENPFMVQDKLITLDTRIEIDNKGVVALNELEKKGHSLLKEFIKKRLESKETPFFDTVKKEKIEIFTFKKPVKNSKVKDLKCDVQLFSRLFIVSLSRSLDLKKFFEHENQACPPSLSTVGNLHTGQKAQLVSILEKLVATETPPQTCDGILYDGPAVVRMMKPREGTGSFQEFSEQITNYCSTQALKMNCSRVDIVWDQYHEDSLKATTRQSRGAGARRPDLPGKGSFPKQQKAWDDYLKNDGNKSDLFIYLAEAALQINNLQVVTNIKDIIKVSSFRPQGSALENVNCAGMEEADGRLFLHAKDMVEHGSKCVMIRCSDTDVVVLAVSFFHTLKKIGLNELWILFGTKANKRFIAIHSIALHLGEDVSSALRGFHAFSGCDTVSFFSGKGKKSAWAAWDRTDDQMTRAFKILGVPCNRPPDHVLPVLERYVVALYGAKESCSTVNDARQHLFSTAGRPVTLIPPTLGCLTQHSRRAAFQAGAIWGRSMDVQSWKDLPSPSGWGWRREDGSWKPHWSDQEDIWKNSRDLNVCGCSSKCGNYQCSCRKAGVPCALSCKKCKGNCSNNKNIIPVIHPELDEDVDGDLL
ncbi:Chromosome-associated kinesin KIF4 [Frankliniella fusca]|uniref:Chromosome-associated kinesin KIF4 n=1 Tax=Frankliniella fusca TaxID=407009 RepID=A0AAE1LK49_9NEOP|nr:Chromosome-associated kinesin KIF4 [Frankliniella fusca]